MPSFYNLTNFRNTVYALNNAIENFYANLLLKDETNRIVYATTQYALRERAYQMGNTDDINYLNLPFLNYYVKEVNNLATNRSWFNHQLNVDGIFVPELNRKLRIQPITVDYDSMFWTWRNDEKEYATYNTIWDTSNETEIKYSLNVDGKEISMIGILNYNFSLASEFNESDWLERNKIRTIRLDFEFQTHYIKDNVNISIPKEVIYKFGTAEQYDDGNYDVTKTLNINHYDEEVSE